VKLTYVSQLSHTAGCVHIIVTELNWIADQFSSDKKK